MGYKTILVHLNDPRRAERLLRASVQMARAFDAHLIGLYVFPAFRLSPPVPFPIGGSIAGGIAARLREDAERLKALFETATHAQPFASEWRSVTTKRRDPAQIVLEQALAADLVMASQSDPSWDFYPSLDFPERLAIEGVRPVLVVPNQGEMDGPPKRIVLAWNGKREAARALFDALPLLTQADQVVMLTIDEGSEGRDGALPDSEIAAALVRQGVKVTATRSKALAGSVGSDIRSKAREVKADLIVMGCYGHSRLFEFAFGGATRHMLATADLPVLMSH